MKTIEERAKEFAQDFEIISRGMDCRNCDTCRKCKNYERYVDIVTEQRAIDIEKACNLFCHIGCPHQTDDYDCLNDKCAAWKKFRKMMEE